MEEETVDSILEELVGPCSRADQLFQVRTNGYRAFNLKESVRVRPSVLTYIMDLDDVTLARYGRQLTFNRLSEVRLDRTQAVLARAIQTKSDADEAWVTKEDLKELDAACTRWCSQTFFPDAFARLKMVLNMCRVYERLKQLTGLKFSIMFKGGVMMRLVLLEFLKNFSHHGQARLKQYLDAHNALSLSDFDFEIVPDDHDAPQSQILSLFALDYAVLLWFQGELAKERDGTAPPALLHMDWDPQARRQELNDQLQDVVDGLPPTHPLHGAHVDRVVLASSDARPPKGYVSKANKPTTSPRNNVVIFECSANANDDAKETCVLTAEEYFKHLGTTVDGTTGGACFYATLNTFIGENEPKRRASHIRGLFHLSRIKHGFVVYYTTKEGHRRCDRLAGEMVDLSQSAGTAKDELRKYLYHKVEVPYRSYPILGVDPKVATLKSFTPAAFFHDLQTQVHNTDSAPWDAGGKIAKRMLRYVAFAIMHVMSPYVPGTFDQKVKSLEATIAHLKRWKDGCASSSSFTLAATGSKVMDAFLARERRTLAEHEGAVTKKRAYLTAIINHLAVFVRAANAKDFDIFRVRGESEKILHAFLRSRQ